MKEMRDFDFEVTFNVSEVFSEDDVRDMLGYSYDLSDSEWKEAAYHWIWNNLKDISNLFDSSFEVKNVKVEQY